MEEDGGRHSEQQEALRFDVREAAVGVDANFQILDGTTSGIEKCSE